MSFDVAFHLGAVERSVSSLERDERPAHAITLARSYDVTTQDVWDAVTNRTRIPRWFLPISGELRLGGRYQLEGNAGGVITACDPPLLLALTWEFGGDVSWVEIHVSDAGTGRSRLTLTHMAQVSEHWGEYGPGATGVGWELGLSGLAIHLARPSEPKLDEAAFSASPDGKAFMTGSSENWGEASIVFGTDAEAARAAARRTTAFYRGDSADPA
jgi:uncharacterized protein YndB with AHSA1/START domain